MAKFLIFLVFLAATASAQDAVEPAEFDYFARDTHRIESYICPFKERIDYDPGEIECFLLQVPENREDPDSRFIELMFVKMHSTWDDEAEEEDDDQEDSGLAPGKRDDVVIYLSGGPGAGAEGYVDRFYDHGIRKHRDMYVLEQRGIVNSSDFCLKYGTRKPERWNASSIEESSEASRQALEDCMRNASAAGVDLRAYNTIENARDVKALRTALGIEQWNVWGISYGSILGQAYIKEDPEGIKAVALDAIVPLDARSNPVSWRVINWYDRDLKKLDELCQADDDCADAFPDLGQRVRDGARAALEDPVSVEVKDTEIYPTGKAYILSDVAAFFAFSLFYEQSNYPALPAIIDAWAEAFETRDETLFRALAVAPGGLGGGGFSPGMYDAILCNDGDYETMAESIELDAAEFPILTNAFTPEGAMARRARTCVDMGLAPRDQAQYAAVETDIPTLLIEGDMDPITPPPLAHEIAPGFSNMTYVEFPYAGHGPSRSMECGGDMLNSFFDDPEAEPDLSCVDENEAPELLSAIYRTPFAPRMIVLAVENEDDMPKVATWAALSVVPLLVAFLMLTFAPLGRRLNKNAPAPSGGARLSAWAASFLGLASLAIFGIAAAVSFELSEVLLLFGMVPWAASGAWSGLLAGLAGIVAIVLSVRARRNGLPTGTLVGFVITGLSAISLSAFLLTWGLGP